MTTELRRRPEAEALANTSPIDGFQILDHIAGGMVAPRRQQPTLATVSAGFLQPGSNGGYSKPVVSRDGTIYVNGKPDLREAFETVPGLAKALQATKRKRLTIAFPFDDPAMFIQQRFARYSATALELYGDQDGITRIKTVSEEFTDPRTGEIRSRPKVIHEPLAAGSDEFIQSMEFVKTQTSVYFLLAEWTDGVARVVMSDGVGLYRLRMTSRNSINSIINSLRWVSRLTGGRLAGVPFDLYLDNQDVVAPDGKRRAVPVWQLFMKPPEQISLTTANFQAVMTNALEQGERLKVLPPPRETVELAELEAPDVDLDYSDVNERQQHDAGPALTPRTVTQREVDLLARGGLCDPAQQRAMFFRCFNHTDLRHQETRAKVISEFTNGRVSSLRDYFADASDNEARALFIHCQAWADRQKDPEPEPVPAEVVEEPLAAQWTDDVSTGWASGDEPEPDEEIAETEPPAEDENLDLLSLYRDRLNAIESAKDQRALGLAGHDVARDEGILTPEQINLLREAYKKRSAELGAS